MTFACPYCQHTLKLKTTKPGRYGPKCPRCTRPFQIIIPEDTAEAPLVQPLPAPAQAGKTLSAPGPPKKSAPNHPPADDPHTTGAYAPSAEEDPFASGADVPSGKTVPGSEVSKKPKKAQVKTAPPPEDPDTTGGYLAPPEDPDQTAALDSSPPEDPGVTEALEASGAEKPSGGAGEKGSKVSRKAKVKSKEPPENMPGTLGGYEVLKELGRGGMGAVYLGRQMSLDRHVALKVMNQRCASDPSFVARFVREAYAAAQLVHHNVVQIYDIGAEKEIQFFSMEFVKGESLMDLVRRQGKIDAEVAVGYILQAARGLKFGHDMGMVHRDVKPDNLMLNDQGLVKVADLGLVKVPGTGESTGGESEAGFPARPGQGVRPLVFRGSDPLSGAGGASDVTRVGVAIGTPTYMAPEQALDASHVDSRADIYSLGCTLYVLLTGKPPFEGKTVLEVLTKHASEPIVPPDVIVKRVSKALSAILLKMLAKKPEDRYPDMAAVIAALEKYLGIQQTGPFTPREEHAALLEQCVKNFNGAPKARLRGKVCVGFFAGCALAILACLLFGQILLAGGIFGLALLTPLSYMLIQGGMEKTPLFGKFRELVLGTSWSDLLYAAGGMAFFLLILFLLHLLWVWIGFCVLAVGLGVCCYFLVDRPIGAQRAGVINKAEKLFRTMRLQGLEEQDLRQFVCKYSGRDWEEFYEALFGYEAKLTAREWGRGEAGRARGKYAAWRDPLIRWMDARQQARKEARERRHLQQVEAKALQAEGMDAAEAQQKAEQMADVMVAQAAEIKKEAAKPPSPLEETVPHASVRDLLETAQHPEKVYAEEKPRKRAAVPLAGVVAWLLGAKVRFVAGAVLFSAFFLWLHQNKLLDDDNLQQLVAKIIEDPSETPPPYSLPFVPDQMTNVYLKGFQPGVASLILLVSAFLGAWRMSLLIWPAAVLAVAGPLLGVPALGPLSADLVSMGGGLVVAVLGFFLFTEW